MKLEIGNLTLNLFENIFREVIVEENSVKVLNGRNETRIISISNLKCTNLNKGTKPDANEGKLNPITTRKCTENAEDSSKSSLPCLFSIKGFSEGTQDLQGIINKFREDFDQQREEFLKTAENWAIKEDFKIANDKICELEDEFRRRLDFHSSMFNDQRAVNTQ